jgi:hypothetical protein
MFRLTLRGKPLLIALMEKILSNKKVDFYRGITRCCVTPRPMGQLIN